MQLEDYAKKLSQQILDLIMLLRKGALGSVREFSECTHAFLSGFAVVTFHHWCTVYVPTENDTFWWPNISGQPHMGALVLSDQGEQTADEDHERVDRH